MKITGVKATLFNDTAPRRARGDHVTNPRSENVRCLVELTADTGLSGIGIAAGWAQPTVLALVQDLLIGEDPRATTALWQRMGKHLSGRGDGAFLHARAVLDLAIWDLKARAQDEPLWKTLGGARPRANAYASWVAVQPSDEAIVEWFGLMSRDYGLRGGKLPVGEDVESDMRRLGLVRDALMASTTEPELMIDAGGLWWPSEGIRKIRQIEAEYDLTFVQRVVESGDFLGSKRLVDGIRAAVCVGGDLATSSAFLPFLHHHAANVIEIDLHHFGITGALQLADAAYGFELPVTLTAAPGNIHVHLAAVMPNFMSMEVIDPGPAEGVIANDVKFESGWGIAGDAAGNGLTVRRELLAKTALDKGN